MNRHMDNINEINNIGSPYVPKAVLRIGPSIYKKHNTKKNNDFTK